MEPRQKVLKTFCTSQEAAEILGVSQRTVQLWVESNLLEAWKTLGGHRRISRQSIESLLAVPPDKVRGIAHIPAESATGKDTKASPFHIMVVEDDLNLRKLYELNMSRWPMMPMVTTAGDGYEALIRMGDAKPNLLVLDLRMPGMDGFRMLKTIRNTVELAHTAIVVVTGLSAEEIKTGGMMPDDIPVLPKPIPFERLKEIAMQLVPNTSTEGAIA